MFLIGAASGVSAQNKDKPPKPPKPPRDSTKPATLSDFYRTDDPLEVTFTANFKRLKGDRGDNVPYRAATIAYTPAGATAPVVVPVRAKVHGIWRLKNCDFPPLRLNFDKEAKESVFHGIDKPKFTSFCRDDDTYEQYVLQELQAYRIYRALTPAAHAARALHVTYVDSASGKPIATRWAFFQEDPDKLAERLNSTGLKQKGAGPDDLQPYESAVFGLFQYLIGNTDFSISALHNVEVYARADGSDPIAVARDFDFSGLVNARYATTDPKLPIRNVRDRLFRGYCVPDSVNQRAFALFNAKKDTIYGLYHDKVGSLLKPKIVEETTKYFDEFYKTINDPKAAKREIAEACYGRRGK